MDPLKGLMIEGHKPLAAQLAEPLAQAGLPSPDFDALSALMVHAEDTTGCTIWEFGGLNPYGEPDQVHEVAGGRYRVWTYSWCVLVVIYLDGLRFNSTEVFPEDGEE